MNGKRFYISIILIVVLSNFGIFSVGGRAVTASELLMLYLIGKYFLSSSVRKSKASYLFLFLGFFPIINILTSIDAFESLKAVIPLEFYMIFSFVLIGRSENERRIIIRSFIYANVIAAVYGIIQFIIIRVIGLNIGYQLAHPWGNFTALRGEMNYISRSRYLWRSNSFFSEPSLLGLFSIASLVLLDKCDFKNKRVLIVVFVGSTICSLSASALVGLFFLLILRMIMSKKHRLVLWPVAIVCIIFILPSFMMSVGRISELISPGSSGYMRITAPLKYVGYVFRELPFGTGLGALEKYLSSSEYLSNQFRLAGGGVYIWVSNTILIWFIAYGYIGILVFSLFLYFLYVLRNNSTIYIAFACLLFHVATGSFYSTIEWVFLIPFLCIP